MAFISNATGIQLSTGNVTNTPLGIGGSYVGAWEDISAYSQVTITLGGKPSVFQGDLLGAPGSLFFEFSNAGITADVSVPIYVDDIGYFIPYPLINVGKFFRVRYNNDGGASAFGAGVARAQTAFSIQVLLHNSSTKDITRTLAQPIRSNQPVTLTRGALLVQQPDDSFKNVGLRDMDAALPIAPLWETMAMLGKGYVLSVPITAIAGTTETNFLLVRNPAGSGKLVRIYEQFYGMQGSALRASVFQFYVGAVVTIPGTPITISKTRPTVGGASACSAFLLPTTTSRGTLLAVVNSVGGYTFVRQLNLSRFIEPGTDLLVTVTPTNAGTPHFFTMTWGEVLP